MIKVEKDRVPSYRDLDELLALNEEKERLDEKAERKAKRKAKGELVSESDDDSKNVGMYEKKPNKKRFEVLKEYDLT